MVKFNKMENILNIGVSFLVFFFFFFFNFSLEKSNWVYIQIFFWKKDLILYMHASRGHSNLDTAFESSFFPKNNYLLCYIFSSNE